jgi:pimeloyl-ACP methyl ester carboxylesterase
MHLVRRVLKWLGLFILVLLAAGTIYQQIGTMIDARTFPPPGQIVEVDGTRIHVLCTGAGERTFVLDAGLGAWSFEWYRIQPALARLGRVCAFDRSGLGWSEAGGTAFDGAGAATELSKIVAAARIPTPFVYVGHSLGANFAQIYAAEHPNDVEALILIEPGDPKDMLEDFHGSRKDAMELPSCNILCVVSGIAGHLGATRIASHLTGKKSFAGNPLALAQYRAGVSRNSAGRTAAAYLGALPKTAFECMDIQSFDSLPILMLASSELRRPEGKETEQDVITWRDGYRRYLASVAAKSSHGEGPIVIPNSTHSSIVLQQKPAKDAARAMETFVAKLHR